MDDHLGILEQRVQPVAVGRRRAGDHGKRRRRKHQQKLEEKLKAEKAYEKWTYVVSKWTIDPLFKERKDLLVEKKEEKKEEPKATENKDESKPAGKTAASSSKPPPTPIPLLDDK